jgi:1,4-alpha-glucan branching enzyme
MVMFSQGIMASAWLQRQRRKDEIMIKKERLKQSQKVKLTFVLPSGPTEQRVAVLGDFNNWNPTANPLVKRSNGTMSTTVMLDPGQRIRFRYYAADGAWFNDETADAYEIGEYGSENCVIVV